MSRTLELVLTLPCSPFTHLACQSNMASGSHLSARNAAQALHGSQELSRSALRTPFRAALLSSIPTARGSRERQSEILEGKHARWCRRHFRPDETPCRRTHSSALSAASAVQQSTAASSLTTAAERGLPPQAARPHTFEDDSGQALGFAANRDISAGEVSYSAAILLALLRGTVAVLGKVDPSASCIRWSTT